VALKLKYQVEQVVCCEMEESQITKANSSVITRKVVRTAKEAGGRDHPSCVIFCLLVCKRWFKLQASKELWDEGLHMARATACEVLAKKLYAKALLHHLGCLTSDGTFLASRGRRVSTSSCRKPC
jgi:hypothetical protein